MKTNIEVMFVVVLLLLNVVAGGFFLYLIFTIQAPDIHAEIELVDVFSDELHLKADLSVSNPNPFDLNVRNIKITSLNDDDEFTRFSFSGGSVGASSDASFGTKKNISFSGNLPRVLKNTVSADVGVKFLGLIEKVISVTAVVDISLEEFLNKSLIPDVTLRAGIDDVTEEGLLFYASVKVENPSNLEVLIDDIEGFVVTEEDAVVGHIQIDGGLISPQETSLFDATGLLHFDALDAHQLFIDIDGRITAEIAGLSQTTSLTLSSILDVPDLAEILHLDNETLDFTLAAEFKVRLRGLRTQVRFRVYNPTNIPLEAKNLVCSVYGLTDNASKLIVEQAMNPCTISSKKDVCIHTDFIMPYLKVLTAGSGRFFPQWFGITIVGDFSIQGTDQVIPISINGYVDPHIFT